MFYLILLRFLFRKPTDDKIFKPPPPLEVVDEEGVTFPSQSSPLNIVLVLLR